MNHKPSHCPIGGKRRYETMVDAEDAMKYIQSLNDGREKPMRVYHCYQCDGWHMTREDLNKRRERIAESTRRRIEWAATYWMKKLKIKE